MDEQPTFQSNALVPYEIQLPDGETLHVKRQTSKRKKPRPEPFKRIPQEAEFYGDDYLEAPELYTLCVDLINKYARFSHLANVRIETLWKRKGGQSRGKLTLGQAQSATGLAHYFGNVEFVIWLAADHCRVMGLDAQKITAALFHELCHIDWDDAKEKAQLIAHDFEGFVDEMREFGLWRRDLEVVTKAAQQMPLFES